MPSGFTAKQYIMEQYKASLLKTKHSVQIFIVWFSCTVVVSNTIRQVVSFSFNTLCKDLHVISQKPIVF